MIVRTHDYAAENLDAAGHLHRLHWQKGMFLRHPPHGKALLEHRGRELHISAQAEWPEYFMNILRATLEKLITDNWPGLKDRYRITVPCSTRSNGQPCSGRFRIDALHQFLAEGDRTIRCQDCGTRHTIVELLFGFEDFGLAQQLQAIEDKLTGLDSRLAHYFWATLHALATESKDGPRLFTLEPADNDWRRLVAKTYRLYLWCEAEAGPHRLIDTADALPGVYEFHATRDWLLRVMPYVQFVAGVLKTVLPPIAPGVDTIFGPDSAKDWGLKAPLKLAMAAADDLRTGADLAEDGRLPSGLLSEDERSGTLTFHALLRGLDPNHQKLGLHRVATYTGEYRWLCDRHYQEYQPKIPDRIDFPSSA